MPQRCRGQVKLYSDFFQSDIIVASPIALATKLADKDSPEEVDFLSSVEIVVAARCDVCQMQNWSHMVTGDPSPSIHCLQTHRILIYFCFFSMSALTLHHSHKHETSCWFLVQMISDPSLMCISQFHVWNAAVFGALNGMPKDLHDADVMRVREWYLAGHGADYRQNILLSSFLSPELHALFSNLCHSHAGKAKLQMIQEVLCDCCPPPSDLEGGT